MIGKAATVIGKMVQFVGEKAILAVLKSVFGPSKKAEIERNKELGKRAYRRPGRITKR